jgi:hypothetical protein
VVDDVDIVVVVVDNVDDDVDKVVVDVDIVAVDVDTVVVVVVVVVVIKRQLTYKSRNLVGAGELKLKRNVNVSWLPAL